ncbi:hypothetical protein GVO57_10210 [Sphingomonas changnyeongensis]|uniref:HTH marR-type domain-containing protein n=1 Tax=Sphingomonas changnyeongensis TaxID=2698679 RepID=A0A7Z2S881_9SPHN|nr:winged helix DNA-binding protein [Sphingomonas changnyeongensis]QHL91126.1 hypothetical protein GVO57_10210 [Sphingomonas changnyeongensis]
MAGEDLIGAPERQIQALDRGIDAEQPWSDAPAVIVVADRGEARALTAHLVADAGGRVVGTAPLAEGRARLDAQVRAAAVVIELDGWAGAWGLELLQWANEAARIGRVRPLICFPAALIDTVMATVTAREVELLCDPSPFDRLAALRSVLFPARERLFEQGLRHEAERLSRLSDETARIAAALADMSGALRNGAEEVADAPPRLLARHVRAMIRLRRLRGQAFSDALFADPAWDMMLDLLAARLEGVSVAVSSLCIAANVPSTTALRWIRMMTDHGLLVRRADPDDGRRIFIDLSESALVGLLRWFEQAHELGWRPH